mmetsp:Transcript_33294/g.49346  ORF Transcript_33294/g.49346 Transcript_33294/m.49346 type:complete len:88 (-) Transcript_33294:230-493(-)
MVPTTTTATVEVTLEVQSTCDVSQSKRNFIGALWFPKITSYCLRLDDVPSVMTEPGFETEENDISYTRLTRNLAFPGVGYCLHHHPF